MVELLGPQNRKMVELLGVKFAPKRTFSQNFRGAIRGFDLKNDIIHLGTPRLFWKFRHFRKNLTKWPIFRGFF